MVPCEDCHGKRYNRETLEVRFRGKSIADVLDMTINMAVEFFENIPTILSKIKVLQDVGLGYIKLGQPSTTLSGGESQRVKLATELAKKDTGNTLYVLDEPTTGLHFEDIRVLLGVLNKLVEKGKSAFVGPEIKGKRLGVIGLGAIGILVANAAHSLGMEVYGYDPYLSVDAAWGLSRSIIHATSLDQIYANCDYITVHVPLTPDTKGMFNAAAFAAMPDGVRILNFSRADLVNIPDMKEALASGKVAAYVVDFPTEDILGVENVIAIPHLGASTPESEDNCAVMAVREIVDYIENGNIRNSVNLPNVEMAISGNAKICVIHKNAEGLLNNITAPVSAAGLNIENMVSKSKKDYAYTCLDVKGDASGIEAAIKAVSGVVSVRVIK